MHINAKQPAVHYKQRQITCDVLFRPDSGGIPLLFTANTAYARLIYGLEI